MLSGFDDDPAAFYRWLEQKPGWILGDGAVHPATLDHYREVRFGEIDASADWDDLAGAVIFVRSVECSPIAILESLFGEFDPSRHKLVES